MKQIARKRHREKRMRWLGTQKDLVEFVLELDRKGWIALRGLRPSRDIKRTVTIYAAVIANCFVDRHGKPFKPDQLRVVKKDDFKKVPEKMRAYIEKIPKKVNV